MPEASKGTPNLTSQPVHHLIIFEEILKNLTPFLVLHPKPFCQYTGQSQTVLV